jgi:hypothetical protein
MVLNRNILENKLPARTEIFRIVLLYKHEIKLVNVHHNWLHLYI